MYHEFLELFVVHVDDQNCLHDALNLQPIAVDE